MIKIENNKLSLFNKDDWPEMVAFITDKMLLIEEEFGLLIAKWKSDKNLPKGNKVDAIVLAGYFGVTEPYVSLNESQAL